MPAVTDHRRAARSAAALVVAILAAAVLGAVPASAHAVLTATTPERGATVTEQLDVVTLQFSEAVAFPQVQITGPGGERVEEGLPVEGGQSVEQALPPVLEHGTYAVAFRVTSDDGHPVEGEFEFSYEGPVGTGDLDDPPAGDRAQPGTEEGGGEVEEEEAAADLPSGAGIEDTRDVDLGGPVLVVALLALLGFAGAAVLAVRRRGGRGDRASDRPADDAEIPS